MKIALLSLVMSHLIEWILVRLAICEKGIVRMQEAEITVLNFSSLSLQSKNGNIYRQFVY